MKNMTLLLSLLPAVSYAHHDVQQDILASIFHSLTSAHHSLSALVLIIICVALVKNFSQKTIN